MHLDSFFQTYKGLIYMLLTGILLFSMVKKLTDRYERELLKRKKTEEQVTEKLEENKRFGELLDYINSGLVISDALQKENPIIYVNKGFEKLTGYSREEAAGRSLLFLQEEAANEISIAEIKNAIEKKEPLRIETENYKKNGQFFWSSLKISPVLDEIGRLTHYIAIQHDITEEKKQSILIENQFKIVKVLLTMKNQQSAFKEICQIIENHMDYQCLIYRYDQKKERLIALASASLPQAFLDEISDYPVKPDEGVTGEAIFKRRTIIIDNVKEKLQSGKFRRIADTFNIQSIWSTPIITADGKILGALTMYKKLPYHPSKSELQTLETYAYIISLVMENLEYEKQLHESEQRYRLIAENVTDIICLLDENNRIIYISPAVQQLIGKNDLDLVWDKILSRKMINRITRFISYLIQVDDAETAEIEVMDTNGEIHWLDLKGKKINDKDGRDNILIVARDITARKQYQQSLDNILYIDSLTQLPNRYKLRKDLEEYVQSDQSFYLVILDFDHLKKISRSYELEIWDNSLLKMKKLIIDLFEPVYLSRSGEDEFCFIPAADTKASLQELLEQFFRKLQKPWKFGQQELILTPSIGIIAHNKQTADRMIAQAQDALQQARHSGADFLFFQDTNNDSRLDRYALIRKNLFMALDRDELEVVYQPKVDTKNQKVIGFEALVRWQNNQLGNVPPGEFIPIAEETGWIIPIGEYVIGQVIKDVLHWEGTGSPFHVAVNISYKQLMEADFVKKIKQALNESNCPGNRLSFEITESLLVEDIDLSIGVLKQLHELGIQIEVDDFGVGYSSLSYLRKFPLDVLKIDRSFVQNIHKDSKELAIVQAIMEMSRALGLEVIAEGVENKKQIQLLQALGCTVYQGYWFSKPLKKKDIDQILPAIRYKLLEVSETN